MFLFSVLYSVALPFSRVNLRGETSALHILESLHWKMAKLIEVLVAPVRSQTKCCCVTESFDVFQNSMICCALLHWIILERVCWTRSGHLLLSLWQTDTVIRPTMKCRRFPWRPFYVQPLALMMLMSFCVSFFKKKTYSLLCLMLEEGKLLISNTQLYNNCCWKLRHLVWMPF